MKRFILIPVVFLTFSCAPLHAQDTTKKTEEEIILKYLKSKKERAIQIFQNQMMVLQPLIKEQEVRIKAKEKKKSKKKSPSSKTPLR